MHLKKFCFFLVALVMQILSLEFAVCGVYSASESVCMVCYLEKILKTTILVNREPTDPVLSAKTSYTFRRYSGKRQQVVKFGSLTGSMLWFV